MFSYVYLDQTSRICYSKLESQHASQVMRLSHVRPRQTTKTNSRSAEYGLRYRSARVYSVTHTHGGVGRGVRAAPEHTLLLKRAARDWWWWSFVVCVCVCSHIVYQRVGEICCEFAFVCVCECMLRINVCLFRLVLPHMFTRHHVDGLICYCWWHCTVHDTRGVGSGARARLRSDITRMFIWII